jgi:hypothetical protein
MQTKVARLEADFESHGERRQRGAGKQKWRWMLDFLVGCRHHYFSRHYRKILCNDCDFGITLSKMTITVTFVVALEGPI